MNMITKIARLKHPGVIRDFTWPVDLPPFGRFNLIYGWNGSGKTTVSRVLRCLEKRIQFMPGRVTLQVGGDELAGHAFPTATAPVRVFNRDFVDESVFPTGGGDVPPILVVGTESVEKQKAADRAKTERAGKESELNQARTTLQTAERELDRHCTNQAKVVKDTLRVPGAGQYNEYDKRAYRSRAKQMMTAVDASSHRLSEADRDTLLLQHRAHVKPKVAEVSYALPDLGKIRDDGAGSLATTVTSDAIAALKDDPTVSEWTRHGLGLHKERRSTTCLFCEQALPACRMTALEAHFSAEYDRFLQRVNKQAEDLRGVAQQASNLRLPDRAALYEHLQEHYDFAQDAVATMLDSVSGFVMELVATLDDKAKQPFKSIPLAAEVPEVYASHIERINAIIRRHNTSCDDFQSRTSDARDGLASDLIAQSGGEFARLAAAVKTASDAISPLQKEVTELADHVASLEREIVEHRQPAEELNDDLRKYLGHDELSLEVKETGYQLLRHGVLAGSLSEGERTALALLYFLKTLSDRRFDLEHGIVVLDDPVSSLDSNALYLAFGFIRQRTQGAGQLFLLTHNFTFFRQVRNWFHHLKGQNKNNVNLRPARFYMLDRVHGCNPRCTTLRALDPLLRKYESEYHYLFACVHRAANATGETDLKQNYGLPNVARRLLEMFLAFRRPQIAGELWQKLKDVAFDEAKKVRIARFVHTHSHGDTVGEPEHDPSLLGEASAVLTDLLELVKSEDPQHFTAMVGLVSGAPVEEGSE